MLPAAGSLTTAAAAFAATWVQARQRSQLATLPQHLIAPLTLRRVWYWCARGAGMLACVASQHLTQASRLPLNAKRSVGQTCLSPTTRHLHTPTKFSILSSNHGARARGQQTALLLRHQQQQRRPQRRLRPLHQRPQPRLQRACAAARRLPQPPQAGGGSRHAGHVQHRPLPAACAAGGRRTGRKDHSHAAADA